MRRISKDPELSEYLAFNGLEISRDSKSGLRSDITTTERDISNQTNVKQTRSSRIKEIVSHVQTSLHHRDSCQPVSPS